MTYAQAIIEMLIQLAPSVVIVFFVFIMFTWIRILLDKMSGRGM